MRLSYSSSSLLLAISICFLAATTYAQPRTPQLPTPPPMRFVTRDDRSQLTTTSDSKARVRLTIELSDARLARTEALTSEKQFEMASEALGNYLGLIEDVMHFIGNLVQDRGSTRDLYRRVDISLRAQIPRLAVMRRITPAEYATHIKVAEEFARNMRTEALDSFYGYSILRENPRPETKADAAKDPARDNKRP
jgi:hypothetical protein